MIAKMITLNIQAAEVLAAMVTILTAGPVFACNSGPDFCSDDPRITGDDHYN